MALPPRWNRQREPGELPAESGGNIIFKAHLDPARGVIGDLQFHLRIKIEGKRFAPAARNDDLAGRRQPPKVGEPRQHHRAVPHQQGVEDALIPPRRADPHQAEQQREKETGLESRRPSPPRASQAWSGWEGCRRPGSLIWEPRPRPALRPPRDRSKCLPDRLRALPGADDEGRGAPRP